MEPPVEGFTVASAPETELVRAETEVSGSPVLIREGYCDTENLPPVEAADPAKVGDSQALDALESALRQMRESPVVSLENGLTPKQAEAKRKAQQERELEGKATRLAADLAALTEARDGIASAAESAPPLPPVVEDDSSSPEEEIGQLAVGPVGSDVAAPESAEIPLPAAATPADAEAEVQAQAASVAEPRDLDILLQELSPELREQVEQRMEEFGEDFDEAKFVAEHPEDYGFITETLDAIADPAKRPEAVTAIKNHLDQLKQQEDGDKKQVEFLSNLFGFYKRRLEQEKDPKKRQEMQETAQSLSKELAREVGIESVGLIGFLLELTVGAVVSEVGEQLK